MKDFNSYAREENGEKGAGTGSGSVDPFELFSKLSREYEGKSSDEMIRAIIKEAEKGRKNGTLTDSDIDNFASAVAPLLNDKQRKMLGLVVARLKQA